MTVILVSQRAVRYRRDRSLPFSGWVTAASASSAHAFSDIAAWMIEAASVGFALSNQPRSARRRIGNELAQYIVWWYELARGECLRDLGFAGTPTEHREQDGVRQTLLRFFRVGVERSSSMTDLDFPNAIGRPLRRRLPHSDFESAQTPTRAVGLRLRDRACQRCFKSTALSVPSRYA